MHSIAVVFIVLIDILPFFTAAQWVLEVDSCKRNLEVEKPRPVILNSRKWTRGKTCNQSNSVYCTYELYWRALPLHYITGDHS